MILFFNVQRRADSFTALHKFSTATRSKSISFHLSMRTVNLRVDDHHYYGTIQAIDLQ